MSMTRRVFGKLAALSPVAAPVGVAAVGNQMALADAAGLVKTKARIGGELVNVPTEYVKPSFNNWWGTKELIEVLQTPDVIRERIRSGVVVERLDPDLHDNKSMSLSAKMLVQRERIVERVFTNHRRRWLHDAHSSGVTDWPDWVTKLIQS